MKPAIAGDAPYKVPRENNRWPAILLAVAMHAGLFAMLWIGVHWQNDQPVAVEAEVWDMKVQSAAPPPPPPVQAEEPAPVQPPPPPPPPPPKEAAPVEAPPQPNPVDIALEKRKAKLKAEQEQKAEQQRQQKLEDEAQAKADKLAKAAKDKADAKAKALAEQKAQEKAQEEADAKAEKALADKKAAAEKADKAKRAAAEAKKLDDAHKAEMARILGTSGNGTSGTAAKSTAPRQDSGYVAAITAKIRGNIAYGDTDVPGNPRAVYRITQLPTGEIISVQKVKSSGIPAYDDAVEKAIQKSSPLPRKKDGSVEREIEPGFNLKDIN